MYPESLKNIPGILPNFERTKNVKISTFLKA